MDHNGTLASVCLSSAPPCPTLLPLVPPFGSYILSVTRLEPLPQAHTPSRHPAGAQSPSSNYFAVLVLQCCTSSNRADCT